MKTNLSKQKVIEAASALFFQKGFHGTSVRDIAEKANVNVSLISYYFKGKQGLLEYAVTDYYEKYLDTMEEALEHYQDLYALDQLKELIFIIIQYKQSNHQFSCFIHRELSLDSVFVREMAVTYLAKENYFISRAFFSVLDKQHSSINDRNYLLMQLKGMLITPYIMHNEWKNHIIGDGSHDLFVTNYVKTIHRWLDFLVEVSGEKIAEDAHGR
ncbi:forespore capture DNA-binding protein RefZ [Virgibacillus sp. AGTR]|uniref:forespore capture DNA-binding protein RefZ n=1 Tax=Virgibacillus TaxID=84406 RepID=UPI00041171C0|nr:MULTISPECIES: forespore capture DNA-binding protein RefZ [Bacillaceae]MCC2250217.1 forespore capture DNA-binding protein RefZ [Virgibacillus sp. AGTR]QRZ17714.1 forespore capture DNA-binding protein RefZ [Virgibacillus sp. AGTR]